MSYILELQSEKLLLKYLFRTFKKLVSILATPALVTKASKKNNIVLKRASCIYYPVWFKKDKVKALINSGSKVKAIILAYALKLGLKTCSTNVRA